MYKKRYWYLNFLHLLLCTFVESNRNNSNPSIVDLIAKLKHLQYIMSQDFPFIERPKKGFAECKEISEAAEMREQDFENSTAELRGNRMSMSAYCDLILKIIELIFLLKGIFFDSDTNYVDPSLVEISYFTNKVLNKLFLMDIRLLSFYRVLSG